MILSLSFACGSQSEDDTHQAASTNDEQEEANNNGSNFEETMNDLWAEMDSIAESNILPFAPSEKVNRKPNGDLNKLNTYNYKDVFEYAFPEPAEFEEIQKEDHMTYAASLIIEGKVYAITVDDYTADPSIEIDKGFTNFIHKGKINHMGGKFDDSKEIKMAEGQDCAYACYSHQMGDNTYYNDYLTYGIEHYIIHLTVTSKLDYEAANKVQQFVDGFKIL